MVLFTLDEIEKAVFNCDRKKSPSADGFSMAFFQESGQLKSYQKRFGGCA